MGVEQEGWGYVETVLVKGDIKVRPLKTQYFDADKNVSIKGIPSDEVKLHSKLGTYYFGSLKRVIVGYSEELSYYSMSNVKEIPKMEMAKVDEFLVDAYIREEMEKYYEMVTGMFLPLSEWQLNNYLADIKIYNKKVKDGEIKYAWKHTVDTGSSWSAVGKKKETSKKAEKPVVKKPTYFERLLKQVKIPEEIFIEEEKWSLLLRNVAERENTLLVGAPGAGKTWIVSQLAKQINKRYEVFNMGDNLNPMAKLIGKTWYDKDKGMYFKESRFVNAIQDSSLINFDDVSRAHPDLANVLFSILDHQRYLSIDETKEPINVPISENCVFFATANEGREYTGTLKMDRAFKSRWSSIIEFDYLAVAEEMKLIAKRVPKLSKKNIKHLVTFADKVRELWKNEELSTPVDTRQVLSAAKNMADGMTLSQALKYSVIPYYSILGGASSERTRLLQIIQMHGVK